MIDCVKVFYTPPYPLHALAMPRPCLCHDCILCVTPRATFTLSGSAGAAPGPCGRLQCDEASSTSTEAACDAIDARLAERLLPLPSAAGDAPRASEARGVAGPSAQAPASSSALPTLCTSTAWARALLSLSGACRGTLSLGLCF